MFMYRHRKIRVIIFRRLTDYWHASKGGSGCFIWQLWLWLEQYFNAIVFAQYEI